jgi:hypothetical protein
MELPPTPPPGCSPITEAEYYGFCHTGPASSLSPLSDAEVRLVVDASGALSRGLTTRACLLYVARPARLRRARLVREMPSMERHRDFYEFHSPAGLEDMLRLARGRGQGVWRMHIGPLYENRKVTIMHLEITKDVDDYFWVHYYLRGGGPAMLKCDQLPAMLDLLRLIASTARRAARVLPHSEFDPPVSE